MGESVLHVEALEAGYDGVQVLWGVSLAVARGGMTTLVGANGAGKTTSLRAITGNLRPFGGKVWFAGEWPEIAGDGAQTGRFAGPVGAHQRRHASARDGERHAPEHLDLIVAGLQGLHVQNRLAHISVPCLQALARPRRDRPQ